MVRVVEGDDGDVRVSPFKEAAGEQVIWEVAELDGGRLQVAVGEAGSIVVSGGMLLKV